MEFHEKLQELRKQKGLTQEELGGMVGVSKQTISGWEHDTSKPNANYLRELCMALGCSADYLLELTDDLGLKW